MSGKIALCIDEQSCLNPSTIGLDGETLDAQPWLEVFSTGLEARAALNANRGIEHAWVVSCDDVEPINLAATLKGDRPDLGVALVGVDADGSLLSRAYNAEIDEVMSVKAFVRAYLDAKGRLSAAHVRSGSIAVSSPVPVATSAPMRPAPATLVPQHEDACANVQLIETPLAVAHPKAFVLPIVGGSGGVGKSAVAAVSAHISTRMGYRTLLLDYDLQFGDMSLLAGVDDPLLVDDAIARPDLLERELERREGLVVLAAPRRLEDAEAVVGALPGLLDKLAERFDVIVANTGAAWAEQHAVLLERSSCALFLVDQRATSVRACKHALELCSRCGIASGPFRFVVNRCAKGSPLSSIDVSCALRGVPVFELKEGGRDVEDYLSVGAVEDLMEARNDFCTSVGQLLAKILPDGENRISLPSGEGGRRKGDRGRGKHAGRRWGRSRS